MFIFTRTLVTYARTIFKPRCCLNFQSMRTQAESTYIAHNMSGQIKMEIPWHTLISRKRDGKPRMIGGHFVVARVGVHQPSVFPNTSHPMLQYIGYNGYNGGWPSARLFGWSAADWSRPATNKSISSERKRKSLLFCWERESWTSWLLTCCSKKGWAAEKSSKTV